MARDPDEHSASSRQAAYASWANTTDRGQRLKNAHHCGPGSVLWHARRLFGDIEPTPIQWKQAEDARVAWLKANSVKGVRARQLKRAQAMREKAARIESDYGDE